MSQNNRSVAPGIPKRAVRQKTLLGDLKLTSTTNVLRRSYEQIKIAGGIQLSSNDWDVLLIAHHFGNPPAYEALSIHHGCELRVVGRHQRSALRVETDSAMSLRHGLCLLNRAGTGEIITRVLDLSSSGGILTEDEKQHRSLASSGPLALRMGQSCLFVVYRRDLRDGNLPSFESIAWGTPIESKGKSLVESELGIRARTNKSKFASVTLRGLPADDWYGTSSLESETAATLMFESEGKCQQLVLSQARLRSGCLIGRDLRCHINSERVNLSTAISRLHCLLIEIDGQPMLVDIASTNGIYVNSVARPFVRLSRDQATKIELARNEYQLFYMP